MTPTLPFTVSDVASLSVEDVPIRARRATVEDLPALQALWQRADLPWDQLDRFVTEFLVVPGEEDGMLLAAIGLQVDSDQALAHSEAILPGRLIGGDHYNPFTGTIHLYSDVPAIALHEGGHAKDFTRRALPGTYALVTALPFGNLWPEAIATGDAITYAGQQADPELERESYRILFPAYGSYLGGSVGDYVTPVALPIYAGAVVAGHAVGRVQARLVPDAEAEAMTDGNEIKPLPEVQVSHEEPMEPDGEEEADRHSGKPWYWPWFRR